MFDSFPWKVASRNLLINPGQTFLTMSVVALSTMLVVFLTAIMAGVQRRLVNTTTDSIPHVVIEPGDREPRTVQDVFTTDGGVLYAIDKVKVRDVRPRIDDWQYWLPQIEAASTEIVMVSPVVEGQGLLSKGAKEKAVRIIGVDSQRHEALLSLGSKLVDGRCNPLTSGECVIGLTLAGDFGLRVGDKILIQGVSGERLPLRVAGIISAGSVTLDEGTAIVPLRDAQSLFAMGRSINSFQIKIRNVFDADKVTERLANIVPQKVTSWTKQNGRLLSTLRGQQSSTRVIIMFTGIAAALAVASIMIVAVMSRLPQIGVLKAVGATPRQVLFSFLIQGTIMTTTGATVGVWLGWNFTLWIAELRSSAPDAMGRNANLFTVVLEPSLVFYSITIAALLGMLSSLYPALCAARVNPIKVIRGQ